MITTRAALCRRHIVLLPQSSRAARRDPIAEARRAVRLHVHLESEARVAVRVEQRQAVLERDDAAAKVLGEAVSGVGGPPRHRVGPHSLLGRRALRAREAKRQREDLRHVCAARIAKGGGVEVSGLVQRARRRGQAAVVRRVGGEAEARRKLGRDLERPDVEELRVLRRLKSVGAWNIIRPVAPAAWGAGKVRARGRACERSARARTTQLEDVEHSVVLIRDLDPVVHVPLHARVPRNVEDVISVCGGSRGIAVGEREVCADCGRCFCADRCAD